jgi:hypothetical protein
MNAIHSIGPAMVTEQGFASLAYGTDVCWYRLADTLQKANHTLSPSFSHRTFAATAG